MLVMKSTSVSYDCTPSRMLSNLRLKLVAFWFFRLIPISRIWDRRPNEAGAPATEKKTLPRQPPIPAGFTSWFQFFVRLTTQAPKRPLERGVTDFVFGRLGLNLKRRSATVLEAIVEPLRESPPFPAGDSVAAWLPATHWLPEQSPP